MNRVTITFPVENISVEKLLNWAKRYDVFTLLNSNSHSNNQTDNYSNFDVLLAVDPVEIFMYEDLFHALKFISDSNDWYILHLSYDLKNKIETLSSTNPDKINFPEFIIYRPAVVFEIREKSFLSITFRKNILLKRSIYLLNRSKFRNLINQRKELKLELTNV